MKKIKKGELDSLCIYRGVLENPAVKAAAELALCDDEKKGEKYGELFCALADAGAEENLSGYIASLVLSDDNPFSRRSAFGKQCSDSLLAGVSHDLKILQELANARPEDMYENVHSENLPLWKNGDAPEPLGDGDWSAEAKELWEYHKKNSYGVFAKYKAFSWRNGSLEPIGCTNPIKLEELKSYEYQRGLVVENTINFIEGLPANNVLLYGDRGTGKSSTVHAILNEFADRGLRMVEMPKSAICQFPALIKILSALPLKFIVFIDDLSFSAGDDSFAELKAALEGGLSARQANTLIYATSNLRHLVREKFSDRDGDDLHSGDARQEQMSLSDRFGLSVTFVNPDRMKFYDILDGIAADRDLEVDAEELHAKGEKWALERGGRSPRVAKQFINVVEASIKRGLDW